MTRALTLVALLLSGSARAAATAFASAGADWQAPIMGFIHSSASDGVPKVDALRKLNSTDWDAVLGPLTQALAAKGYTSGMFSVLGERRGHAFLEALADASLAVSRRAGEMIAAAKSETASAGELEAAAQAAEGFGQVYGFYLTEGHARDLGQAVEDARGQAKLRREVAVVKAEASAVQTMEAKPKAPEPVQAASRPQAQVQPVQLEVPPIAQEPAASIQPAAPPRPAQPSQPVVEPPSPAAAAARALGEALLESSEDAAETLIDRLRALADQHPADAQAHQAIVNALFAFAKETSDYDEARWAVDAIAGVAGRGHEAVDHAAVAGLIKEGADASDVDYALDALAAAQSLAEKTPSLAVKRRAVELMAADYPNESDGDYRVRLREAIDSLSEQLQAAGPQQAGPSAETVKALAAALSSAAGDDDGEAAALAGRLADAAGGDEESRRSALSSLLASAPEFSDYDSARPLIPLIERLGGQGQGDGARKQALRGLLKAAGNSDDSDFTTEALAAYERLAQGAAQALRASAADWLAAEVRAQTWDDDDALREAATRLASAAGLPEPQFSSQAEPPDPADGLTIQLPGKTLHWSSFRSILVITALLLLWQLAKALFFAFLR